MVRTWLCTGRRTHSTTVASEVEVASRVQGHLFQALQAGAATPPTKPFKERTGGSQQHANE